MVEASQLRGKDKVSQLRSSLILTEHSQQSYGDENKKLLADNLKLLHQQDQLKKDISDLKTVMTGKDKQITELTVEGDKLQAEVAQLKLTILLPTISSLVAVLKVIPFELDNEWADADDYDDISPAGLAAAGSDYSHVTSLGELSPPANKDTSCSDPRQAPCVDFTSGIEANSIQCDQQDGMLVTGTPIYCEELLEDCSA